MKIHELKQDIKYFEDEKAGKKNFVIRKNDRDYQVGDVLELKAYVSQESAEEEGLDVGYAWTEHLYEEGYDIWENCEGEFETHRAIFLNEYGKNQQPEIPEFVGKYIKETADPIHEMCAWSEHYGDNGTKCDDPELSKMLDWFGMNRNMFYEAVIKGYTVKEKRYYLELKLSVRTEFQGVGPELYLREEQNYYYLKNKKADGKSEKVTGIWTLEEIEKLPWGTIRLPFPRTAFEEIEVSEWN